MTHSTEKNREINRHNERLEATDRKLKKRETHNSMLPSLQWGSPDSL